jgi:hypothetical protein
MMVRKHHWDCVWYLLANDRVIVEWWVECKAVCGVQWQEDMCMLLSVAYSISVCECSCYYRDTPQNVGVCQFWHSFFLKMSVVRFLELIAKIGIAKLGIAKIGIPIGMDR